MKPTVRIKNWTIIHGGLGDWIEGVVEDHPRFPVDTPVRTSKIVHIDPMRTRAETLNTIYLLVGPEAE